MLVHPDSCQYPIPRNAEPLPQSPLFSRFHLENHTSKHKTHNKEGDVPYKTVEELQQALRDRGLPVERIYPMLEFEPIKPGECA